MLRKNCITGLISNIEECQRAKTELPEFKLADLARMYKDCLKQLGQKISDRLNTTRLKERILFNVPDLDCYKVGCDVFLAFSTDVGNGLKRSNKEDCDDNAMDPAKTAAIVCNDKMKKIHICWFV